MRQQCPPRGVRASVFPSACESLDSRDARLPPSAVTPVAREAPGADDLGQIHAIAGDANHESSQQRIRGEALA